MSDLMKYANMQIPFLNTIGIIITYKCQVACPHCILNAGPHRTEDISLLNSYNWIKQISGYRNGTVKMISLTGGEPFYDLDRLEKISAFAKKEGLLVSVVTNAFWADTSENAEKILQSLSSIDAIAISSDYYHQASIPFNRVVNAIQAAKKENIPYYINVCTENAQDLHYKSLLEELHKVAEKDYINSIITFPYGRAAEKSSSPKYKRSKTPPVSCCISSSGPVIFPDGKVIGCIGPLITLKSNHPLILGNLNDDPLITILNNAESNSILHALRIYGPQKLISMAIEAGLQDSLPESYIEGSICSACYSMMSNPTIVNYLSEIARDPAFIRLISYARLQYLGETRMAEWYESLSGGTGN